MSAGTWQILDLLGCCYVAFTLYKEQWQLWNTAHMPSLFSQACRPHGSSWSASCAYSKYTILDIAMNIVEHCLFGCPLPMTSDFALSNPA